MNYAHNMLHSTINEVKNCQSSFLTKPFLLVYNFLFKGVNVIHEGGKGGLNFIRQCQSHNSKKLFIRNNINKIITIVLVVLFNRILLCLHLFRTIYNEKFCNCV